MRPRDRRVRPLIRGVVSAAISASCIVGALSSTTPLLPKPIGAMGRIVGRSSPGVPAIVPDSLESLDRAVGEVLCTGPQQHDHGHPTNSPGESVTRGAGDA